MKTKIAPFSEFQKYTIAIVTGKRIRSPADPTTWSEPERRTQRPKKAAKAAKSGGGKRRV